MITGQERLHVDLGGDSTPVTINDIVAFVLAAQVQSFTTTGGTVIPAGTLQSQIQAVGNIADPS